MQRRRQASRRILLVALLAIFAAATATAWQQAARATPEAVGLSSSRLREATALLNSYVTEQRIAGAVAAVARRGQVAYLEAVGVQDLQTRAPMTERSLFRIYSMTQARHRGRGDDAPRGRALRARRPGRPVHPRIQEGAWWRASRARRRVRPPGRSRYATSCCTRRASTRARPRSTGASRCARARSRMAQFIANLVRVPLMEDPGTRYRYSEGTTVLGTARRDLVGQTLRGVSRRAYLPSAPHDRHDVLGRDRRQRARGSPLCTVPRRAAD